MPTASKKPSELIRALNRLHETPAIAVCDDTPVQMPSTRFVADHCLATYATRSKEGFAFVPAEDESIYRTYATLRSANEAWRRDKLPVLSVCAFSTSPIPFEKRTGIQTDTVDQFLTDLKLAHSIVPTLNANPAYIVRRYHSFGDKYDDVILPAHANLVVYQPHALSPAQLTSLFQHVADVRGKVILCDDRSKLADFYPELTDAVERSLSKALPPELRQAVTPRNPTPDYNNALQPGISSAHRRAVSDFEGPRSEQLALFDFPSARGPYLVYHAKPGNTAEFPNGYDVVALVRAENIHRALAHTQHFGAPWTENPGVVTLTEKEPRSTQPGDVIVHDGVAQRFEGAGFKHIEFAAEALPLHAHDRAPSFEAARHAAPEPELPRQKIHF